MSHLIDPRLIAWYEHTHFNAVSLVADADADVDVLPYPVSLSGWWVVGLAQAASPIIPAQFLRHS